ncbi:beta-ketoacyl synthase N-terminal-like domain-containing protein, partial [Pseudomonas aeruginosa]|uniref:beta-ketoacyl synthase N-terminal-like domain-containing protein n=2 Tax=Bacteria TaxID=2 RepID=UPI002E8E7031|nr:beta-ketoacyl synthase N-terminal-like domain-containing protein [Pseudomonas aeruginosa]
ITGIGTVSPIGNNTVEFWESIKNDRHGIAPITKFDASATGISVAAEVKNFNGKELLGNKEVRRMDYFSQYGLVAAMEAVEM